MKGALPVMRPDSWRVENQTSTQRGYGYAWQKARAGYLRSHPFCVYCMREAGIEFTTETAVVLMCAERDIAAPYGTVVDHIEPHRGNQQLFWDKTNWQTMCASHHSSTKQREEAAGAAIDGSALPIHPGGRQSL